MPYHMIVMTTRTRNFYSISGYLGFLTITAQDDPSRDTLVDLIDTLPAADSRFVILANRRAIVPVEYAQPLLDAVCATRPLLEFPTA